MKIKLMVTAAAVLGVMAMAAPMASAATTCGEQTSQARDYSGSPDPTAADYNPSYGQTTGSDTQATSPADGAIVYGSADQGSMSGYGGLTGPHGFLDVSGSSASGLTVQGYQPESGVDGKATVGTAPSACVLGTKVL